MPYHQASAAGTLQLYTAMHAVDHDNVLVFSTSQYPSQCLTRIVFVCSLARWCHMVMNSCSFVSRERFLGSPLSLSPLFFSILVTLLCYFSPSLSFGSFTRTLPLSFHGIYQLLCFFFSPHPPPSLALHVTSPPPPSSSSLSPAPSPLLHSIVLYN